MIGLCIDCRWGSQICNVFGGWASVGLCQYFSRSQKWSTRSQFVCLSKTTKPPRACSATLQLLHDRAGRWCTGEYCPHKNVCPPQRVSDHSATSQIFNLKSKVTVSLIRLKECVVGKWAKELVMNTRYYKYSIISIINFWIMTLLFSFTKRFTTDLT